MTRLLLLATGLLLVACDTPETPAIASLPGAQFLTFRCFEKGSDGGMPLEGCGCTVLEEGALRRMGSVECDCLQVVLGAQPTEVDFVKAPGCAETTEGCEVPRGEDGDWTAAAEEDADAVECVPRRAGAVRAYVGSASQGELSVVDISSLDVEDPKEVVDVSKRIPGITAIFVDDLISDVVAHPHGNFIFTVNSSSGSLAVIRDERLREAFKVDLGSGPLFEAIVWPRSDRRDTATGAPKAWVSAPTARRILEIDLDALGTADAAIETIVTRAFALEGDAKPGRLTVDEAGEHLYVAHARDSKITVIDLVSGLRDGTIDLVNRHPCPNGYLTRLLQPGDADPTCDDGLDNDGDGAVDGEDTDCASAGSEAYLPLGPGAVADPRCVKLSECFDGEDNDGDGLLDEADPDCDPANCTGDCASTSAWTDWERPELPVCADGVDNDDDGLIDFHDPGCANEADGNELDDLELGDLCDNGTDDDGDGLTDGEDPGCNNDDAAQRWRFERIAGCSDGVDNDADGAADFPDDAQCFAASDTDESSPGVQFGPQWMRAVTVHTLSDTRELLYVLDPSGGLMVADVGHPSRTVSRLRTEVDQLALAIRDDGEAVSLLSIGEDNQLRSIEVNPPGELRSADGRPVFGRMANDGSAGKRQFTTFYVVEDGLAWALDDPQLRVYLQAQNQSCDDATPCPSPMECASDLEAVDTAVEDADGGLASADAGVSDGGADAGVTGTCAWPSTGRIEVGLTSTVLATALPPLEERTAVEVSTDDEALDALDGAARDPLVFIEGRTLQHGEANLFDTARLRTSTVATPPRLLDRNLNARFEVDRHPVFCRLAQPGEETAPEGCIPVGLDETGETEEAGAQEARLRFRTDDYEGIQILEDDPTRITADAFTLTYEAELPRTERATGQYAGTAGTDEDPEWVMIDLDTDFCARGVEVGDLVVVDRFVPTAEAAEAPECSPYVRAPSVDQNLLRDPLRWRVVEVGAHRLVLGVDDRLSYAPQLGRDDRSPPPELFDPPAPPPADCAAQFINYRIRVGVDQWLLVGRTSGYRHPWINQDGQCVERASYVQARRFGRATLNEVFESDWFRFHLGASSTEFPDTSEATPKMLDMSFEFEVFTGRNHRRLSEAAILPREMHWLPTDDHLYVVDSAIEALVEIAGLDVFESAFRRLRTLR